MSDYDQEEGEHEERSFFQRYRLPIVLGSVVLLGVVMLARKLASGEGHAASRPTPMVVVSLPPPPPAPTPPPIEQPKIVEQEQTFVPEDKPVEQPPPDEPPIGTNIKGDGSNDSFGLGNKPGNGRFGSNKGNGSRFGAYASQVQSRIEEAMRGNRKTRDASLSVKVRIWPDASGRITRAKLAGSSGDLAVDAAIESEVLNGLQLREPPPSGMPTPILLRLTARRAN